MSKGSKAEIKRKDGRVVKIDFEDILDLDEGVLVKQVHRLEQWIDDLKRYRDITLAQAEEVKALWDEGHTKRLRQAIELCSEQIDEAIQRYEVALYDATLLVGVRRAVAMWLAANPEYNHIWIVGSDKYSYCKRSYSGRGRHTGHPLYDAHILKFPS